MNVFDFPVSGATLSEVISHKQQVQDHIRNAADPNETGGNGRTLLELAIMTCFEGRGEDLVSDLLRRGAEPNRPSPWAIFVGVLMMSNSVSLVKELLDHGLRLNDVFEVEEATGGLVNGPSTILDHAYAVRDYIAPKRKKIDALANKYAGGLGRRRRFIDETIAVLESAGAKRAADLPGP